MAKSSFDEVTEQTIGKGGILVKLFFDMQSEKEDDLQPLMADLINNQLLKAPGVIYCFGSIDTPIKLADTYSTNAQVTVLFKDLGSLINVVFNFVPVGVEILKPEKEFVIRQSELQSILIDLSNVSINYSQYILSRVLTKEDYEKVMHDIKNREEVGKHLIKKEEDKKGATS